MKKIAACLFLAVFFISCGDGEGYYSYLSEPGIGSESVKMKFVASGSQPLFNYAIQSKEMVVDWGDGSPLSEYFFKDDIDDSGSIKAISHFYASAGTYAIEVRALQLRGLRLSLSGKDTITELSLTDCFRLRSLFCDNQPIPVLDISGCPELRILSCGYPGGSLLLTGLYTPRKLGELYIKGPLTTETLEVTQCDSLRVIHLENSNQSAIRLNNLSELKTIGINSCAELTNIYIENNTQLSDIVLTNNSSLDAGALNKLFEALPLSAQLQRYITLSGNKGDDACNRSIATNKGWNFR